MALLFEVSKPMQQQTVNPTSLELNDFCLLWDYIVWLCVVYNIIISYVSVYTLYIYIYILVCILDITSSFTLDFHKPTACSLMSMFSSSCEGLLRITSMDIPKSFQGTRSRSFQSTWRTSLVMGATPLVATDFRNGFPGICGNEAMDKIRWGCSSQVRPVQTQVENTESRIRSESSLFLTQCIEATIAPPSPTPQILSFQTVAL